MKNKIFYTNIILIFSFIVCFNFNYLYSQTNKTNQKDTIIPPKIKIIPQEIFLDSVDIDSKFVTADIKILNKGQEPLKIYNITGSCKCATTYVNNYIIYPLTIGKVTLNVNLEGLEKSDNTVEYLIETNATIPISNVLLHIKFKK